jgi:hypothetical protein
MEASPRAARGGPFVQRETVIEVVGYVGAAVGLSAAGIAIGESSGTGVQIAFDLITTGVLLVAGWAIGGESDALRRMKSVFWFLSVFGVADLFGVFFGDVLDLSGKSLVVVTGLVVTVYALALWWLSRRSLQVVALFLSGLVVLGGLVFPDVNLLFGPPDLTGAAITSWLYGWAWVGIGATGAVQPRRSSIVLGSIAAIFAPLLFVAGGDAVLGEILSLASAIALLAIVQFGVERGPAGLAIAGILVISAAIVGDNVDDQGPAIAVLVLGLVLLGGAIVGVRSTMQPPSGPPIAPPGPQVPPSGPPAPPPAPPAPPTSG